MSLKGTRHVTAHGNLFMAGTADIHRESLHGNKNGVKVTQTAGHVYLSSPCYYRHGVDYPGGEWDDRIVALQFRFLVPWSDDNKTAASRGAVLKKVAGYKRETRQQIKVSSVFSVFKTTLSEKKVTKSTEN